jgi:S1-C subfamily serine protease
MDCAAIVKKIKPSIAFIATFLEDNSLAGTGSGFIFGRSGVLVTCNHVVKGAHNILLKFPDSNDFLSAKTVLQDEEHDLALLKFDNTERTPLNRSDLKIVEEGMEVIFAGYPLGRQDLTTHQGIISSITTDQTGIISYLIDGTVNSGNSGCPLMDKNGEVIGVVNAKRIESGITLRKIEEMSVGAVSLHGVDLVEIYQALVSNVQLGVGVAVPASYIPEHKEMKNEEPKTGIKTKK